MPNDTPHVTSHDDRFRNSLLALPLAIYATDASGLITFFNPAAVELAGRTPQIGRDRWCVTWRLRWPDGRPMPHEDCPMAVALRENRPMRAVEAIGERPNGTLFSFLAHPTPIRDAAGAVVGGVNVLLDITTDRKTADSLQRGIVRELDRKASSILRLIDAVLKEAHRQARGTEAQKLIQRAIQRVVTISATQGLLLDPDGGTRINSWDLLTAICLTVPLPMQDKVELLCESAAGDLASETAIPLSLIAKELIANAASHALSGRSKVSVRIGLRRQRGGYIFTVEDDGPGFALRPAHARSFGLGLVMALARQLNGTFDVERGSGARCIVRFPDPRTLN
ncbi:MAG TPA: ATP-binding protein [Hyphomicrobiaceae bacterium]|jgi:PAS domain S-box-containing protein